MDLREFKANLVYRSSSRTAKTTRDTIWKIDDLENKQELKVFIKVLRFCTMLETLRIKVL